MQAIGLSFFDWVIILVYFAFVIGMGFYLKRYTGSEDDFFLAGRRSSSWVAGLAFLSANLGALELLGMAGNTFKYEMYVAHFYWIGAIPAMLSLGIFMMPFYYSGRVKSVPGYLKLRFDEKTRVLNGAAFAIMTLLVSGINLYAMALVLHTFVGWNWDVSMWASALTVAVYVALSGLMSAIFSRKWWSAILTAAIPNVVLPGFVVPPARENFFFVSPVGPEASALHAMPRGWRNGGSGCGRHSFWMFLTDRWSSSFPRCYGFSSSTSAGSWAHSLRRP
jgi:SSS family solute:Na+ symporter